MQPGNGINSVTNDPAHIRWAIAETIKTLGTKPDLYYLHRIDPNTPLEKSIGEMQKLKEEGLTKYIGLSECSAETLRKADKSECPFTSPPFSDMGIVARIQPFVVGRRSSD